MAYVRRLSIMTWNTACSWWSGIPCSRSCLRRNIGLRWLQIVRIASTLLTKLKLFWKITPRNLTVCTRWIPSSDWGDCACYGEDDVVQAVWFLSIFIINPLSLAQTHQIGNVCIYVQNCQQKAEFFNVDNTLLSEWPLLSYHSALVSVTNLIMPLTWLLNSQDVYNVCPIDTLT